MKHCSIIQHRNGHQLQTAVTWVLDELERNQKIGKSSKNSFQDDGHLSSGPAVHVYFQDGIISTSKMAKNYSLGVKSVKIVWSKIGLGP